ncbi:citrate lyase holo-[acyl-carrier protein] synthase [Lactobacillus panisapium]|uniref:citrate lyase holo-[acyl-carrier protein] synthase n=1 Tax=Lactobacillus panisapium TaxID=2012495 RepID=UPI001C697E41|nr:citrate lyase holo-[acyl-carrier protein] synthase [Lactobacillus panisapium]QYN56668.1 citrate lyase holo-[acyl-carrier protein] synthase [Lactobacillus panisapium]
MTKTIFASGTKQSIEQVLADKDQRVNLQKKLFREFPHSVLLDVKLNIPGPIKNNQYLKQLFLTGIKTLEKSLKKEHLSFKLMKKWDKPTGCENFYLVNDNSRAVKKTAIDFENQSQLTRLFDADVLVENELAALSRTDLDMPTRKCFLCDRPAKECARSRRHSVQELQEYISQIYYQQVK